VIIERRHIEWCRTWIKYRSCVSSAAHWETCICQPISQLLPSNYTT